MGVDFGEVYHWGEGDEISFAGWRSRSPAGSLVRRLRLLKVYNCTQSRLGESRSPAQRKSLLFKSPTEGQQGPSLEKTRPQPRENKAPA